MIEYGGILAETCEKNEKNDRTDEPVDQTERVIKKSEEKKVSWEPPKLSVIQPFNITEVSIKQSPKNQSKSPVNKDKLQVVLSR